MLHSWQVKNINCDKEVAINIAFMALKYGIIEDHFYFSHDGLISDFVGRAKVMYKGYKYLVEGSTAQRNSFTNIFILNDGIKITRLFYVDIR